MKNIKKELLDFYENTRQYYGNYHNHKEISAWAGLVLYILFCTFIANIKIEKNSDFQFFYLMFLSILILLIFIFVSVYIENQLSLKDQASALATASKFILNEILKTVENEIDYHKYLYLEESTDPNYKFPHVMPKYLLFHAEIYNRKGIGAQDKTRFMVFGILILTTLSILVYFWSKIL